MALTTFTTYSTPEVPTEDSVRAAFKHAELLTRVRLLESTLRIVKAAAHPDQADTAGALRFIATTAAKALDGEIA